MRRRARSWWQSALPSLILAGDLPGMTTARRNTKPDDSMSITLFLLFGRPGPSSVAGSGR